jgi:hypothetical protein
MLVRLAVAASLALVAVGVAALLNRRVTRRTSPIGSYDYPRQLTRADFARPDAPWLVVVFSSTACDGCVPVVVRATALASGDVAVVECEYGAQPDLHRRYAIEGVPTTVIADAEGVVRRGFVGSVSAADLAAALTALQSER